MKITLKDLAGSLDLPTGTIDRWIRQGRIPVKRQGEFCAFDKVALKRWAKNHNLSLSLPGKGEEGADVQTVQAPLDSLLASMKRGRIVCDMEGTSAETIFKTVVNCLSGLSKEVKDELFERLLQREELVSTGIGKGVAIPHPRSPLPDAFESPVILTCFLKDDIDFGAVDDRPVFVMFFLFSPSTECHLHLLSRLSYCLRDNSFIGFLKKRPDESVLFDRIEAIEKEIDRADGN